MIAFSFLNQDNFNMLKITRKGGKKEKPILSTYCPQACVKHIVKVRKKKLKREKKYFFLTYIYTHLFLEHHSLDIWFNGLHY